MLAYSKLKLVLFAIEIYCPALNRVRVLLNPRGLLVPDTAEFRVFGYVIASDQLEADRISLLLRGMT